MTPFRFLDLPILVRDQIYTELLVLPITESGNEIVFQEAPPTDIFYTNKQIYAEASDIFYSQNLFTVVSTNYDEEILEKKTRQNIPIFCEPKDTSKIAHCSRFALTIEILDVSQLFPATGTPAFIVTAHALPYLARYYPKCLRTVRMKVEHTFRYTTSRFSQLTFERFYAAMKRPQIGALQIEGSIESSHFREMVRSCVHHDQSACDDFKEYLRAYKNRVWFRMQVEYHKESYMEEEIPEAQVHELPKLMIRMYDVFWDCHIYRERELQASCGTSGVELFVRVAKLYNTLIHGYFLAAQRYYDRQSSAKKQTRSSLRPRGLIGLCCHLPYVLDGIMMSPTKHLGQAVVEAHVQALRAAQEGITYLNRDDRIMYADKIGTKEGEKLQLSPNFAKATLSRRASEACSRLGRPAEAKAYRADCLMYGVGAEADPRERRMKFAEIDWPTEPRMPIEVILWRKQEKMSPTSGDACNY